ncbi:hypothetical protein [Xanthomonas medicagonis]
MSAASLPVIAGRLALGAISSGAAALARTQGRRPVQRSAAVGMRFCGEP